MLTGIDLLIFALCMIGFGYVLSSGGNKSERTMKVIMKEDQKKHSTAGHEVTRFTGEGIAERNRREYDLIAQADKQDFIQQLIN